ncbi:hypothetical protein BDN72DRAFT_81476 [Pluteus cervinus]|uniref:Uncharacterized protein n=1 Tax=Pluteus cervinus TaxID=181527 RepID=A0ACD3B9I5_9AGAR|nr:hypothetical protein BDN72DRAFT_81476 [Pluteus cervinus]
METVANISFKGCVLVWQEYRASLLKNKITKWQTRIEESLDEVLAVKEFLTEDEVRTVCEQVDYILAYIKTIHVLASNESTWFYAHERSKNIDNQSRTVLVVARNASSAAKVRMLQSEDKPVKAEGKGLLDRLRKKSPAGSNAASSFELIQKVADAYTDALRADVHANMAPQISELSKDLAMGEVRECAATSYWTGALNAAEASTSEANEKVQMELEIKSFVRVSRAMQLECHCAHNHLNQGHLCLAVQN